MLLGEFSFLGLNWTTILVHLAVFVVLAVGLTFLVYKPVLQFIRKRQENIQKGLDDASAIKQEGESLKAEYEAKLQDAQAEADALLAEAKQKSDGILQQASLDAKKEREAILDEAIQQAEAHKQAVAEETKQNLGDVAVALARDILQREVTKEDNERLIAESLAAWSEDE